MIVRLYWFIFAIVVSSQTLALCAELNNEIIVKFVSERIEGLSASETNPAGFFSVEDQEQGFVWILIADQRLLIRLTLNELRSAKLAEHPKLFGRLFKIDTDFVDSVEAIGTSTYLMLKDDGEEIVFSALRFGQYHRLP